MLEALETLEGAILRLEPEQFFISEEWSSILRMMIRFMNLNKRVLNRQEDYNDSLSRCEKVLQKNSGGKNISDLLIKDDSNEAIKSMINESFISGVSQMRSEYILIANKIIMRDSKYLNSCFIHFSWALEKYENQFDENIFKPLLDSILVSYQPYFLRSGAKNGMLCMRKRMLLRKSL